MLISKSVESFVAAHACAKLLMRLHKDLMCINGITVITHLSRIFQAFFKPLLSSLNIIISSLFLFLFGLHGGVVVSTVTSQQESSRFNSRLGPFCVEFAGSHRVCVVLPGYSGFLPPSKNMRVRLIGDPKLSLGVSVNVQPLGSTSQCISSAGPKPG